MNSHWLYTRLSRASATESIDRIECIVTYSKGFICSGGSGTLHLFEKTDNKYLYKKSRAVSVWVDPASSLMTQTSTGSDSAVVENDIMSMTLSPSEENIICATRTQQLYNLTLSAADLQGKVGRTVDNSGALIVLDPYQGWRNLGGHKEWL